MATYKVKNVTGIPYNFRKAGTVVAAIVGVGDMECYNVIEEEGDDDGKKPKKKVRYLVFKTKLTHTNHGFKYGGRAISTRIAVYDANGNNLVSNANELSNVLHILCNDKNRTYDVIFKAKDSYVDGAASLVHLVHFSFFHDESLWSPC